MIQLFDNNTRTYSYEVDISKHIKWIEIVTEYLKFLAIGDAQQNTKSGSVATSYAILSRKYSCYFLTDLLEQRTCIVHYVASPLIHSSLWVIQLFAWWGAFCLDNRHLNQETARDVCHPKYFGGILWEDVPFVIDV